MARSSRLKVTPPMDRVLMQPRKPLCLDAVPPGRKRDIETETERQRDRERDRETCKGSAGDKQDDLTG